MLQTELLGTDIYHLLQWFLTYSILGWIVESIYMSICNRELTNRGFARGPLCPIYGVGALSVYFILKPFSDNYFALFLLGTTLATTLEFLTAKLMIKIFGEVWWDYNNKPFNYKGILCLESTIAWGVYTIALFAFLHGFVSGIVDTYPYEIGSVVGLIVLFLFFIDFVTSFYKAKEDDIKGFIKQFKAT